MTEDRPDTADVADAVDTATADDMASDRVAGLVADRAALQRVAGLSTELADISEVEYRQIRLERVVLAGVWTAGTRLDSERSLGELARLAETAGSLVLDAVTQRRHRPDPATFLGTGFVARLRELVTEIGADTVIVDGELSPAQLEHLERSLAVKVVDRTWLILDIFAQHARSREGKAQVALAQLEYMLPRLRGWGEAMSRQGGGIGTRGPGEAKIETDRRRIRGRMARLRRELAGMETARLVARGSRRRSGVPAVCLVGYTNAGKSSLLNRLTGAHALVNDQLFATLDPAVRRCRTPSGRLFTVTDTVGFVSRLPHQLVEAFRSTMEEVTDADLIVVVVDATAPEPQRQVGVVREVLAEIDADRVPELVVVNKTDSMTAVEQSSLRAAFPAAIFVSALTGAGVARLLSEIQLKLPSPLEQVRVSIPLDRGDLISRLYSEGVVEIVEYRDTEILVSGWANQDLAAEFRLVGEEGSKKADKILDKG